MDYLFKHEYYDREFLEGLTRKELIEEYLMIQESYKELERDMYALEKNRRKWAGSTSFLR